MNQNTPFNVHTIVTSAAPRLDALAAIFLSETSEAGQKLFPGARNAKHIFWTGDSKTPPSGLTPSQWRKEGVLYFGRGGPDVLFDEHAGLGRENRMKNTCTTSLLADYLGVRGHSVIGPFVDAILMEDTQANSGVDSLPVLIKLWHQLHLADLQSLEKIRKLVHTALCALLNDEREVSFTNPRNMLREGFIYDAIASQHVPNSDAQARQWMGEVLEIHEAADAAFRKVHISYKNNEIYREFRIVRLKVKKPQKEWAWADMSIVSVVSDSPWIQKVIRRHWKNVAVTVVQKTNGQVHILPNSNLNLDMGDVLAGIRIAEQWARREILTDRFDDLRIDGEVQGCGCWVSFAGMIFNGSLTTPEVEATRLSLGEIAQLVEEGLSKDFEETRSADCRAGRCTATRNKPCPWYGRGYRRCRRVRYNQRVRC